MKFKYLGDFLGCKNYGAVSGKYSFTISHLPDLGWSASWKDREYEGGQSSHFILNGEQRSIENPFKTRDEAETACRHQRKKLRLT